MNRQDRRERVKELRALGWSTTRIGAELGCDHSTVVRDLHKLAQAAAAQEAPQPAQQTGAGKYTAELQRLGPVSFAEGPNGWTGEDGQPITLAAWQRAALLAWWEHRQDVSTFAISSVKKTGKTFADAVLLCWRWLALPGLHFAAANDLDQAQARQFLEISDMVRRSPFLSENVKVSKSELVFTLTGSRLQALALDAPGASGANQLTSSHTEAWAVIYESGLRMWEELTPPPGRSYGLPALRIADSYAGFTGESKTWHKLLDRALAGERLPGEWPVFKAGGLLLFHMEGSEAQERCFRGTEAERLDYYAEQAETLRPNAFTRMHYNQRTAGESAFVSDEIWQQYFSLDLHPLQTGEQVKLSFGADASVSHDFTALVGMDGGDVRFVRVWKPKKIAGIRLGKPFIDLEATIGQEVLNLHKAGQVSSVTFDPYQLSSISRSWERAGVRLHEMPQTAQRVEADTALLSAIESGRIRHYNNQELNEAVRNAVIQETPRGVRIVKERSSRRTDALVAMSMAYSTALSGKYGASVWTSQPDPWEAGPEDIHRYVIAHSPDARPHPAGVTWRTCRNRMAGCAACVNELTAEGFFQEEEEQAAIIRAASPPREARDTGPYVTEEDERREKERWLDEINQAQRERNLQGESNDKHIKLFWESIRK